VADEGSEAYAQHDAIARASVGPQGIDWLEAIEKWLKKDEAAVLQQFQFADQKMVTVDRHQAEYLILSLTSDSFLVGAAMMYRILKGGA
jgi:hypothetical protein